MAQLLLFETPVNVTAASPVNITWNPRTFNSVGLGSFALNLWLLRADSKDDQVIKAFTPVLLTRKLAPFHIVAHNNAYRQQDSQNVFNNSVLWTPSVEEVDIDVPEAGAHQLAWEESINNLGLNPANVSFWGFSQGFNVKAPASSHPSPTSTIAVEATQSHISSSTASPSHASPRASNLPIMLGLSVGPGLLLLACIAGSIWGIRKYRRIKRRKTRVPSPPPKEIYVRRELPRKYEERQVILEGEKMVDGL